jgi:hypothetical protein
MLCSIRHTKVENATEQGNSEADTTTTMTPFRFNKKWDKEM